MRVKWFFLALLIAGCAKDPLSSRVTQLESQVTQLQTAQQQEQQALLARLDQIPTSPENQPEIAALRAKLAQTGIPPTDLQALQARVLALEGKGVDWTRVVPTLNRAVYAVLYSTAQANKPATTAFLATAFAVDDHTLVTNGHVVDALTKLDSDLKQYNQRHPTAPMSGQWVVVQNLTTKMAYKTNYFVIGSSATHTDWNPTDVSSADVGLMRPSEGNLQRWVTLAPSTQVLNLLVGQPIGTLGFPGELQGQGDSLNSIFPIATFKEGTISALRPAQDGQPYNARDTYVVQHNLDLSGGTSGSPIFDQRGQVVAINNAGISSDVRTTSGQQVQVSQAALGFGIRADKIQELLKQAPLAKPVTQVSSASWLEGRDLNTLDIVPYGEDYDLGSRLEAQQSQPQ